MILLIWRWACVAGIVGVLFCGNSVFAQQWERLPLNLGYLDKLVQNPYNPMEIVGYIRDRDFYRSTDGGQSWTKIEQVEVPFRRSYIDLAFDSKSRLYLTTASDGVYRSSDGGITWDSLLVLGQGHHGGESRTRITPEGNIFIWEDGAQRLMISEDDGRTWRDINPADNDYGLDLFTVPENNSIIILLRQNSVVVTSDGGGSWTAYPLPHTARSSLFHQLRDTLMVLTIFSGRDSSELFESYDTAKTWQMATRLSIRVNQGDCFHDNVITEKRFQLSDSTEIYPICHTLQRSTDSGRTFRQITNFRVEDVVQVGTDLIATVPLRGLIRSTDFGDTWAPVPSPPEMFRADHIEFAHAHDDTMFVMIKGQEIPGKLVANLLESDDGGYTWNLLFSTVNSTLSTLSVDAGRPARYYIQARKSADLHILLTGVAGQSVPDTVLVTTSFPRPTDLYPPATFHGIPSERFPGWLYASRNTNSIGWSSNRGESWEWRTLPISCSSVTPCPTQRDPLRIVVAASELNPIPSFDYSGLYLIENGGQSFEWINRSVHISGWFSSSKDDRIFRYRPEDSSSKDYGRTWEVMRAGLDSTTTSRDGFQSHGKTLTVTNTGIYLFDEERWRLLRGTDGNSIWDGDMEAFRNGALMYLDYTGEYIYITIPFYGIYRIVTQAVTGTGSAATPLASTPRLEVFPNPADSRVTISWQGPDKSRSVTLRILDVLGRECTRFATVSGGELVQWDCTGPSGVPIPPGLYFVRLTDGRKIAATKVLIVR